MQVSISLLQTSQNDISHVHAPGQSGLGLFVRFFSPLISKGHNFLSFIFYFCLHLAVALWMPNTLAWGVELHWHAAPECRWEYLNAFFFFLSSALAHTELSWSGEPHRRHSCLAAWQVPVKGRSSVHCPLCSFESLLAGKSNGKIDTMFRGWNPAWPYAGFSRKGTASSLWPFVPQCAFH